MIWQKMNMSFSWPLYQSYRQKCFPILLVLAVALLVGCGKEKKASVQAPPRSNQSTSITLPTPTITPSEIDSSALQGLDGALLYRQGENLYLHQFSSDEPELLVGYSDPETIYLSPQQDKLVYSPYRGSDNVIRMIDLITRETITLVDFSGRVASSWQLMDWSPDDSWIVLNIYSSGMELVKLDGSERYPIGDSMVIPYGWLDNGSLVLIEASESSAPDYQIFDPADQTFTNLNIDSENFAEHAELLDQAISEMGLTFVGERFNGASGIRIVPPEAYYGGSASPCEPWRIVRYSRDNTSYFEEDLYSATDVFELRHLTELAEDRALFLESRVENCRIDIPTVSLVLLDGDESQILTETVFPGLTLGRNIFENPTHPVPYYTVSPDAQYVAWISGGLEHDFSSINFMNLETREQGIFRREDKGSATSNSFIDNQMFTSVYWVAQ